MFKVTILHFSPRKRQDCPRSIIDPTLAAKIQTSHYPQGPHNTEVAVKYTCLTHTTTRHSTYHLNHQTQYYTHFYNPTKLALSIFYISKKSIYKKSITSASFNLTYFFPCLRIFVTTQRHQKISKKTKKIKIGIF